MTELTQEHFEIIDRNKARAYELKKKDREKSYTLQELKASHHNFMLDCKIEDRIDSKKVENLAYYLEAHTNKLKT